MKTPWQKYSGVACSYSSTPAYFLLTKTPPRSNPSFGLSRAPIFYLKKESRGLHFLLPTLLSDVLIWSLKETRIITNVTVIVHHGNEAGSLDA